MAVVTSAVCGWAGLDDTAEHEIKNREAASAVASFKLFILWNIILRQYAAVARSKAPILTTYIHEFTPQGV